jgi:hypothetical protein
LKNINYLKMKNIFISLLLIIVTSCYPQLYHRDFRDYEKEFLEAYNNQEEIKEIKTNGFYYSLDSTMVYLMKFDWGFEYRYKDVIDHYGKTNYKIFETNKAYFLNYFYLLHNGRFKMGKWWFMGYNDFKDPEVLILQKNRAINTDSIINIIFNQIENYNCKRFQSVDNNLAGKGIYSIRYKTIKTYFLLQGQHELTMFDFWGKVKNDSTILIFDDRYKDVPVSENKRFITFKFHKSDVIPSKEFMEYE